MGWRQQGLQGEQQGGKGWAEMEMRQTWRASGLGDCLGWGLQEGGLGSWAMAMTFQERTLEEEQDGSTQDGQCLALLRGSAACCGLAKQAELLADLHNHPHSRGSCCLLTSHHVPGTFQELLNSPNHLSRPRGSLFPC